MDVLAKQSMKQLEKKLFFIPFAFILLRMWGTIQFFFSIAVFEGGFVDATGCVPNGVLSYILCISNPASKLQCK